MFLKIHSFEHSLQNPFFAFVNLPCLRALFSQLVAIGFAWGKRDMRKLNLNDMKKKKNSQTLTHRPHV